MSRLHANRKGARREAKRCFIGQGLMENRSGLMIDTRHRGYAAGQRVRKRVEEAFGWIKTVAETRMTKLRRLR